MVLLRFNNLKNTNFVTHYAFSQSSFYFDSFSSHVEKLPGVSENNILKIPITNYV